MTSSNLPPLKRGAVKAFREYLNRTCVEKIDQGRNSRGQVYVRRTRGYGDYLYSQDREMFDFELHEALYAGASKDFNARNWLLDSEDANLG